VQAASVLNIHSGNTLEIGHICPYYKTPMSYYSGNETSEFRRYLREQGCTFEEGKRQTVVRRGNRFSTLPRHAAKEIGTGIVSAIKKQLGLK